MISYYSDFLDAYREVSGETDIDSEVANLLKTTFRKHLRYGRRAAQWPEHLSSESRTMTNSIIPYSQVGLNDIEACWDVYSSNPYSFPQPLPLTKFILSDGIHVNGYSTGATSLYVKYLPVEAEFKGDEYNSLTAYVVGNVVYYDAQSNFYKCILNSTGNAPTNATYFTKMSFSRSLLDFLASACFSDYLRKTDITASDAEYARAKRWLAGEQFMLDQAQGQSPIAFIKTNNSQQARR